MIISASYKTDIPTFYGQWFMNRLAAGYCKMLNPYNKHVYRVSLAREDVDGFIFWTKNIDPFMKHLPHIKEQGYPFIIQHTINSYPRILEQAVVDANKSIENLKRISQQYGQKTVVWRYDTIVISSVTPFDFHLQNFEALTRKLEGVTDEVVISFAHLYKKTLRNMNAAAKEHGFTWEDPDAQEKKKLAEQLVSIAQSANMQLVICSQPEYMVSGAKEARCIDAERLAETAGKTINSRIKGNRPGCACFLSRDIGEYDTCPHGCVYCYAVQNRKLAQSRYQEHDPHSEFLFTPPKDAVEEKLPEIPSVQLKLFSEN